MLPSQCNKVSDTAGLASLLDGWSTHEVWHVHVDCVGGIEMA